MGRGPAVSLPASAFTKRKDFSIEKEKLNHWQIFIFLVVLKQTYIKFNLFVS